MPTNHDATKVLLGGTQSSDKVISAEPADPASFPAGLAVRRASNGGLTLAAGDGAFVGVSVGRSLSDHAKTAVCRAGNRVPIRLRDLGTDDFSQAVIGTPVYVNDATGLADEEHTDSTITAAIYLSGPLTGIDPITGDEHAVALVDMGGGL